MLAVAAVVGVVTAVALALWTFRVDDPMLVVDGTPIDVAAVGRGCVAGLLGVVCLTGVVFVYWAVRAYRNLPALAIEDRRYWTIWLIVGWVIPGANLLVPKLLVDDLWRASSPSAGIAGGAGWQRRPVASIVNRWWSSFLLTPGVALLAHVQTRGGLDGVEQKLMVGSLTVVAAVCVVVAAVAARGLVAVVTVAQARRADVIADAREAQASALEYLVAMETAAR